VDAIAAHLRSTGLAAGLAAVGFASAERFSEAEERIVRHKELGYHAGMGFTFKNPGRSCSPRAVLPAARALVVAALGYGEAADLANPAGPVGLVARYAQGDPYERLGRGLQAMAEVLRGGGWRAVVIADQNHLVDREAAYQAGLGWYGKNANLLIPGRGSWVVLGSIVTDAPLPRSRDQVAESCGSCRRCIDACPTGAIVAPGVVDARRCLAWIVQAPGSIPVEFREAMGTRIYGCDDCQEVCPPNRADDRRRSSDPEWAPPPGSGQVELLELLELPDSDLLQRHGRWYIAERNVNHIRRNALVALGNARDRSEPVRAVLERYRGHADPMLAEHARWAMGQLGFVPAVVA
jgi:epoxyqueuosine reductase